MRRCSLLSGGMEREAYLQCFMHDGCVKCPYYEKYEHTSQTKQEYNGVMEQSVIENVKKETTNESSLVTDNETKEDESNV